MRQYFKKLHQKVDVKILKEFLGVKIPIPCIPMEVKIGGKTIKRVGSW